MRLRDLFRAFARTARLMVGVPDYEEYLRHCRAKHPHEATLSRAEFHRDRMERRFGGGADRIGRCC